MRLDGADRQEQLLGDRPVRVAERDELQDLQLALGEVVRRAGRVLRGRREPHAECGVEVRRARGGAANGLDEVFVGRLLQDVAERPGTQGAARELGVLLHRQDDRRGARRPLGQHRQRFERRPLAGHVQVEDQHVGLVPEDRAQGVIDVRRLGDDLEVRVLVEQQAQAGAHDAVVVGEDDGDRRHGRQPTPRHPNLAVTAPGSVVSTDAIGAGRHDGAPRAAVQDRGMSQLPATHPLRVVVVGGGIAALETVLALHDLAGDRVRATLIAPEPDFVLRPLAVAKPFARGRSERLPLEQVMAEHGGRFLRGAVQRVDADARTITLTSGDDVAYDALVIALGAREVPAHRHALTFGAQPLALDGIVADLEQGWSKSVAFVVPNGCTWPLPLYELALMTAQDVWAMSMDRVALHLVTPELEPLEIFGRAASAAVADLLEAARITFHGGAFTQVPRSGCVETATGPPLEVDAVIALPLLEGRRLDGIPATARGFIPVDDAGQVAGLDRVYAIGDATDRPIKQGGLACQQADVTAAHIAALAGAAIDVPPLEQVLVGRLLTGTSDRFLRRDPGEVEGEGAASDEPLSWSPVKVSGRYLSPYLLDKGVVHLPVRQRRPQPGIDVRVPLTWQQRRSAEVLGLSPLGPMAIR